MTISASSLSQKIFIINLLRWRQVPHKLQMLLLCRCSALSWAIAKRQLPIRQPSLQGLPKRLHSRKPSRIRQCRLRHRELSQLSPKWSQIRQKILSKIKTTKRSNYHSFPLRPQSQKLKHLSQNKWSKAVPRRPPRHHLLVIKEKRNLPVRTNLSRVMTTKTQMTRHRKAVALDAGSYLQLLAQWQRAPSSMWRKTIFKTSTSSYRTSK